MKELSSEISASLATALIHLQLLPHSQDISACSILDVTECLPGFKRLDDVTTPFNIQFWPVLVIVDSFQYVVNPLKILTTGFFVCRRLRHRESAAYSVIVPNWLFGNNSSKPELARMKFYTKALARVGCSPGSCWRSQFNVRKWRKYSWNVIQVWSQHAQSVCNVYMACAYKPYECCWVINRGLRTLDWIHSAAKLTGFARDM